MQLGEMIATYDVAVALRGESGKFEITSPTGDTLRVTCKPNHSISNLEWSGNGSESQPFIIRKVAETVSLRQTTIETPEGTSATRTTSTPFLIESQEPDSKLAPAPETPTSGNAEVEDDNGADLDLVYMEQDGSTNQPSWRVCIKSGNGTTKAITVSCSNFNELDAEIRRLQAQLDEIRVRARRSVYKMQAVAATA